VVDKRSSNGKVDLLVVDDQCDEIQLITNILHHRGYSVRSAHSGKQAVEIAQSDPPDLILLDIAMPTMDGYETCQQLKSDQRTRHIPVMFVSAMEDVNNKVRAFQVGGIDYVTKPLQFDEVIARIEIHVNIRRLQAALENSNQELAKRLEELDQARTVEREQRYFAEALRETSAAINSTLDYNEVLDLILTHLERVVHHQTANIVLFTEGGDFHIARARGYQKFGAVRALQQLKFDGELLPSWKKMIEDTNPLVIPDTQQEPSWIDIEGFEWVRSYASAPIVNKGEVIGLINLESETPNFFTSEHLTRLQIFADQAAVAIEKARLYDETKRLAITDGLTGVYNRRHLLDLGMAEYERALRYRHPLAAIMVDVDHFKCVNDDHGHPVGDAVLQNLANVLSENLRVNDILGRYGGDEFLILIPETTYDIAIAVAERIRFQIETTPIGGNDKPICITLSLGVAACKCTKTLDDLVQRADKALYAAKTAGRNCVRGFHD